MSLHRTALVLMVPLTAMVFLSTGCASSIAKMSVDGMKPIMVDMRTAANRNPDVALVRDAMPAMLVQMDGFIRVSPENRYLLTSAAEANMGYAFLFVEDTDKARAEQLYAKARDYALRNLRLNRTFSDAWDQDDLDVFIHALKTIHKRDIKALYLMANSSLLWTGVTRSGESRALKDLPRIEAMMDRLYELDETFYYGGIHAMLGVYNCARPEMFGGRPEEARGHFQEAFEISGSRYLLWKFLYAKYYAVAVKDRELFAVTLNGILEAPDDILPDEAFANAAVKLKARELLLRTDEYFP
ncbi:MAG TPA: TRAP transporter TatT component family protein [Deltaproteobacteria bacterium]|nr:TRAP transporter TatT component family protein [Deltaproteobacteria bacterium]